MKQINSRQNSHKNNETKQTHPTIKFQIKCKSQQSSKIQIIRYKIQNNLKRQSKRKQSAGENQSRHNDS